MWNFFFYFLLLISATFLIYLPINIRIPILDIKNRSRNWWISGTSLLLANLRPKTSFKSLIPIAIVGTTSLCLVLIHCRNSANFDSSWVSRIGGNLSISSKDLVYQSRTWRSACMRNRLRTLNPKEMALGRPCAACTCQERNYGNKWGNFGAKLCYILQISMK